MRSYTLLLLSLSLTILLIIAALLPLTPQDYWWYLRLGHDIAASGTIPSVDTYSFTRAGVSFFYQPWLSALVWWGIESLGGLTFTFASRLVIIFLAYGLLWLLLRRAGAGPRLSSVLVLVSGLAGSSNWSFRPQLLIYPLFVLALYIVWQWQNNNPRRLWLLPLIGALWVNLHGSFPLLFLLLLPACVWGEGNRKRLVLVTIVAAACLILNPRGPLVAGYVSDMLASPSNRFSNEWLPAVNRGWQANLFFVWILILPIMAAFSPRKLGRLEWAWFLIFGWLGLYGARYGIWLLFLLPLLSARLVASWADRSMESMTADLRPTVNTTAAALLLLLPLALLPGVRERWWPGAPSPYHGANPIAATAWLADHPELEGPLWSDFSHSSYLIFALPERPVWIDPRFELYPPAHWERYRAIAGAAPGWESLLKEEGIELAMLSTGGEPALIRAMADSDGWCEMFRNPDAVVFARSSPGAACK
jgi:hypothetical protein